MAKFSDIIGQEQLKEYLQNTIREDRVGHAYVINGEKHAGKEGWSHARHAIPAGRLCPKTIRILSV